MSELELLSIGRFARLTGLSIGALRHYDEVGLLTPAEVSRETGYRSCRGVAVLSRLRGAESR